MFQDEDGYQNHLQNIGDISQPFKTDFGWHIIKLVDKKTIPAFADIESELRLIIEREI